MVIAWIIIPVLLQPDCCEDYVRGGLVEGNVENAASFPVPVTSCPLAVFSACNRDIRPWCGSLQRLKRRSYQFML